MYEGLFESSPFFGVFTGTLHVACSCLLKLIYFVYLHFLSFVDEKNHEISVLPVNIDTFRPCNKICWVIWLTQGNFTD